MVLRVANYDFIFPYVTEFASELRERRYHVPPVWSGNRFPTKFEIIQAILSIGEFDVKGAEQEEFFVVKKDASARDAYEISVSSFHWDSLGQSKSASITVSGGTLGLKLLLLEVLSHNCGQLVLHPESGDPAVVVFPGMDIQHIEALWREARRHPDAWGKFFMTAYGHDGDEGCP